MTARSSLCRTAVAGSAALLLAGCSHQQRAHSGPAAPSSDETYRASDCNGVTDADVTNTVGSSLFTNVVVSDAGCFWQENTAIGSFGAGNGISTWWYRGSDLDLERAVEEKAGRTVTELSFNGNKGFRAHDGNACSVYVAKGEDVVTWSIQTVNPTMLPDLCSVVEQLAQFSQDRVN